MASVRRAGMFWTLLIACVLILFAACAILDRSPSTIQLVQLAVLAALAAAFLSRAFRAQITEVAHVAQRTARGDLTAQGEELEAQRSQAQAILESMGEGVLALNRDLHVLWLNAAAQRLIGRRGQPAPNTGLLELIRQPELEAMARQVVRTHAPAAGELHTFGGQERTIRCQVVPCEGGERGAALVVVAQDVTEMRRLEHLRREFVANVSHELKTPLTTIKGLVETLLSGALDDAANRRRFVTLIDQDATRLGQLIDDLLDLSQIESKMVTLTREPVDLRAFFQALLPSLEAAARERQVELSLAIPAGAPRALADPERLRQIFLNLLDNAVKYNQTPGRVMVTAEPRDRMVAIQVADTGLGIPEADLPRIFERFYRVDKARSRALGGTGLGLSIVKHLVELHQGSVEVASRLGQGSTFTILLPRA